MIFKVPPTKRISGSVDLPASKSYSIRAFFVAACGGVSRIIGPSDCDDANVARAVARAFGARIKVMGRAVVLKASTSVERCKALKISVRESGTSLRFVLPLLPLFTRTARVSGSGTLIGRPNAHLAESLRACGLDLRGSGTKESVPITYRGGSLQGGRVVVDGSVSSQFVSALLIAAPRAAADTCLVMTGKTLVSQDYVVMTRQILERAGVRIVQRSGREFFIPGRQSFKGLTSFHVPSDWGLAAFFMSAAALVPSRLVLRGHFDDKLVQSDGAILGFLRKMGVRVARAPGAISLNGPFNLRGGTFSLRSCPDLVPVMAVTAMFAKGATRLKDIGHARVKESDRISDLRRELLKVGADIEEKSGELVIRPQASYKGGVELDPHHDHRLAMAFAVLGLRIGVTIRDMECTAKSYPLFVAHLKKIIR